MKWGSLVKGALFGQKGKRAYLGVYPQIGPNTPKTPYLGYLAQKGYK